MSSFVSSLQQLLIYRGREGQLSFFGRRLAGLGTLFFLSFHILDAATPYFVPSLYPVLIGLYRTTPFMLMEMVLVAAVVYHGVNGLNLILQDTFPHWWTKTSERISFWRVALLSGVLAFPPVALMLRSLYFYNICRCAPAESPFTASVFVTAGALAVFAAVLLVLVWGKSLRAPASAPVLKIQPRRSLEGWLWLLMRLSGLLLVPLAWGHVLLQDALVGVHAITLDYVAARWALAGWRILDATLLLLAYGHGVNGFRGILNEYLRASRWRWVANGLWLAVAAVIFILGAVAVIGGAKS